MITHVERAEALARRVETEPASDGLSYEVARAFGWRPANPDLLWQYWISPGGAEQSLPPWLLSTDAAIVLLMPNWRCNIIWENKQHVVATPVMVDAFGNLDYPPEDAEWLTGSVGSGDHALARAIVAAALRVRAYDMERITQ